MGYLVVVRRFGFFQHRVFRMLIGSAPKAATKRKSRQKYGGRKILNEGNICKEKSPGRKSDICRPGNHFRAALTQFYSPDEPPLHYGDLDRKNWLPPVGAMRIGVRPVV